MINKETGYRGAAIQTQVDPKLPAIAMQKRLAEQGLTYDQLVEDIADQDNNSPKWHDWEERAAEVGLSVKDYLESICESDRNVLHRLMCDLNIDPYTSTATEAELGGDGSIRTKLVDAWLNGQLVDAGIGNAGSDIAIRGVIEDDGRGHILKSDEQGQRNAFTISQTGQGNYFNPYNYINLTVADPVSEPISRNIFLGRTFNIRGTHVGIPQVSFDDIKTTQVGELGQIPVVDFKTSETQEPLWKYGIGLQRSYESDQVMGSLAMRTNLFNMIGRQRNRDFMVDAFSMLVREKVDVGAVSGKRNKTGGTHEIGAGDDAGKWTLEKFLNYMKRWNGDFTPNLIVGTPQGITNLEMMAWTEAGTSVITLAEFANNYPGATTVPRPIRNVGSLLYVDIEGITKADGTALANTEYLFYQVGLGMFGVTNNSLVVSETERKMGIQANIDYRTFAGRALPFIREASELVTLA